MEQFDTFPIQCSHIDICMKEFGSEKIIFDKMTAVRTFFPYKAFEYALVVPSWADQLLPQLLMKQFDTLPIQYRHIEHMYERVWLKKECFLIKWQL